MYKNIYIALLKSRIRGLFVSLQEYLQVTELRKEEQTQLKGKLKETHQIK